ncbi:MAG: GAF domain-containing protein, partial [Planctomycetes bacterium]|nr:GAF domain-containing protein [Planctomycetota bacterium]
ALGWEVGAIYSIHPKGETLQLDAFWHASDVQVPRFESRTRGERFQSGVGLPGRIWKSGEPAWIGDVTQDGNLPRRAAALEDGLRGALGFPILEGETVSGVVEFFSREVRPPDADLHRTFAALGRQIGQFTARRRAEAARATVEAQLRQSQKMDAIGRLAGGVAHDFNNLLSGILGFSDLLLLKLGETDPLAVYAKEIYRAGERAAGLTRQLLTFSRKDILQPAVLDPNVVVQGMEGMLRRLIGEDIDFATALQPRIGRVKADPGQMEQVVLNLVVNARDAMPKGGKLTIETADVELDERYAQEHAGVRQGLYVQLAVSDTGTGMDAETRGRLFEPFFTTKEKGKGTGLGLSTVYGIVQQAGGSVGVYSEPGRGTTFKVYLPRVEAEAGARRPAAATVRETRGTETVLIVEDEGVVRALARELLGLAGYTLLEAQNGGEALLASERHAGPIHLLVTDVVLPQLGGRELAERFMSGYTTDTVVRHGVLEGEIHFLQKPFSTKVFLNKVREVLDAPRRGGAGPGGGAGGGAGAERGVADARGAGGGAGGP